MASRVILSSRELSKKSAVSDPHVSRDGRYITYLEGSGTARRAVRVDCRSLGDRGEWEIPARLAHPFGGGVTSLSPDGGRLYFVTGPGGISRLTFDTGSVDSIFEGPGVSQIAVSADETVVAAVIYGDRVAVFSPSGEATVVSEHRRVMKALSGLDVGLGGFVTERPDFVLDVDISADGSILTWHEWALPAMPWQESQLVIARLDPVAVADISVCAAGGFVSQPRFCADGLRLAFLAETDGYLNLWLADLAQWTARPVLDEPFEHGGVPWSGGSRSFALSPDGSKAYLNRNEGGFGRLVGVDLASGHCAEMGKAHHFALSASSTNVVALRSGSMTPNAIVSYDARSFERKERGRSYGERFYRATMVEPLSGVAGRSVGFDSFVKAEFLDEISEVAPMDIPFRLYRPNDEGGDLSTVATFHGGPTDQALVSYSIRNTAFLQAGYQVLSFDYRGSSGWGKGFRDALDGEFGVAEVADLLRVIAQLSNEGLVRPGKIVVNGGSSGGYSSLRAASMTRGVFSGAIALYPLVDLLNSALTTHRFESRYFDALIGPLPSAADRYRKRSLDPSHLGGMPVLIMHGDSDPVVDHHQVVDFVEAARRLGGEIEFILFEGEGHGFSSEAAIKSEFDLYAGFLGRLRS